ncbi:DNA primase [Streptomyces sp. WELS2]|uniref:DNA primase n=1 Tax=Streptomyces sp. WELS2 TaxID=2749435 RepID=UPI0015F076A2|nr:DNA primase [Streptomyces sp. WELS2]
MNRTALGLAVGAGYMLGRTKKLKMALAVGSLVAGKKLNLSPKTLADMVNQQLKNNPQFSEIGDQLRQDLRGVGKAATGAMVERQMSSLADRLHSRTGQVRDQLSGAASGGSGEDAEEEEEAPEKGSAEGEEASQKGSAERKAPEKRASEKKAPGRKPARKPLSAAGKGATRKTGAAGKAAAKRTAAVGEAARGAVTRRSKGGDDR